MSPESKLAIVAGAGAGLGQSLVKRLDDAGYKAVVMGAAAHESIETGQPVVLNFAD